MYTMFAAGNMAARNSGSSASGSSARDTRATGSTAVATQGGTRNVTSTLTTMPSRLYTATATISEASTLAEPICFILLVDKEVQISGSDSLLYQRHAPSSQRILKGSLLQGNEVLPGGGQSYGDAVKGSKRADAKRYVVKLLSGDMQFQCSSWEVGQITVPERELLRALSTDSQRLNIYQDRDLIPYALGLKEGSLVKVRHRNHSTSPYEEVAAFVRYIGPLSETEMGTQFGLELIDNAYRGQGTTDGVFGKCRYFQTDPDCAVFVPINKLVPPFMSQGTTHLYENISLQKEELPNQPSELPSVGDIIKGTTVYLQVGNSMRRGRVVYMTVPFKETEPYAVMEMPKQEGDRMWNGMHRGYRVFTPRNEVFTTFVPVNNLTTRAPEEYQDLYTGAIPKEPSQNPPSKAKNKGKKSSEPFWAANAKPRKTPSPYGSSEKLDKGSHKPSGGRRDVSDSFYPASQAHKTDTHQDTSEDLQFASGHYSEGSKSKRKSFSGFVNKMKNKWNSGSKDEETSRSSWYTDTKATEADFLEEDLVKEVVETIYKDWRTVGHFLYLSREEIDRIAAKCRTEKDRTMEMLKAWQRKGTGYDTISRLVEACRSCHFNELANELEQGLDETLLYKISCGIPPEKARLFGTFLNFSDEEMEVFETKTRHTLLRVRLMLAKWRPMQSRNSDKIMLLSNALQSCGLRQLALEAARGLDDDIMLSFAVQIGHKWKILATTLRLDVNDIQQLGDFSEDKQPYQMLMLWRRRQDRSVDVLGALAKGLRESGLPDLAYDLVQGVTDEMLYKLAMMIGDKWEIIALHLGFTEEELKELKSDKVAEIVTILNMLTKWRERHDYTRDRFGFLMEALRACGLGNMAKSMEEDRCRLEQSKKVAPSAKTEEYSEYAKDKEVTEADFLDEDLVKEVVETIYKDWRTVGHFLYLSREEIDRFAADCETEEERTAEMLRAWQRKGTGYDNISRLAEACRSCHFDELANKLEQGLDEALLFKIANGIPPEKARPFGTSLNFSDEELDLLDTKAPHTLPPVRFMLAKWQIRQSHNSDKIMLLSNALQSCGFRQLALEVARGLDDDIMLLFAVQIGHNWKVLAKTLRLDVKNMKQLEDFSEDKQPYQMLMLWRRRQDRSVDVLGALAKGLRESGLPDLAYDLVQGVTDEMLYKLAISIGDKWGAIALHLGFTEEEIKGLKKDKFSETPTILNMLTKWRERHDYTRDRFGFLMEALRACGLGNLAESMEEDRCRVEHSKKVAPCAKTEEYPGYAKDKDRLAGTVNREILVKVSQHVNFRELCRVIAFPAADAFDIEDHYPRNEQRVFQVLDCWKRRGEGGNWSISELLPVLAQLGCKPALIDEIKRKDAADDKEEVNPMKQLPAEYTTITFPSLTDEPQDEPCYPDLEVNSMVEVKSSNKTLFGVIRWIGVPVGSKSNKPVAGIELESSIDQGATDGTFNKQRYFQCEPNKAIFVYLSKCRPDSHVLSRAQTFSSTKRRTSQVVCCKISWSRPDPWMQSNLRSFHKFHEHAALATAGLVSRGMGDLRVRACLCYWAWAISPDCAGHFGNRHSLCKHLVPALEPPLQS